MGILKVKNSEGTFIDIPALQGPPGPSYKAGNDIEITEDNVINYIGSGEPGTGGTTNYERLSNKPQINNITLEGNKTLTDLGLMSEQDLNIKLDTKADVSSVYDKNEINNLLHEKADVSSVYDKNEINTITSTKADIAYVNEQLESTITEEEVNIKLSTKVDTGVYEDAMSLKANKNEVYSKEEANLVIEEALSRKADTNYVNEQLNTKINITDTYDRAQTDALLDSLETTFNSKLNTKVDASNTYTKEEANNVIGSAIVSKADTTYVNSQLALKSDRINTYTKEEIDNLLSTDAISGDTVPIGVILPFSGSTTPENWLLCDGREVSRTTYRQLFNVIGTLYGEGDGVTSFNLPDYRDRVPVGTSTDITLASTGGEKTHVLTTQEMPEHTHKLSLNRGSGNMDWAGFTGARNVDGVVLDTPLTHPAGGGQAHNIMQPYIGQNYIIKHGQSAGVVATIVNDIALSESTTDAPSVKAVKQAIENVNKILYDNKEGTISDAVLSDNGTKYDTLIIEWVAKAYTDVWKRETTVILKPENTSYSKSTSYYSAEYKRVYATQTVYELEDNVIRIVNNQGGSVGPDSSYASDGNAWAITKVMGIKQKV